MKAAGLTCTVFWTIDIAMSFLTGFHIGGIVEMRLGKIARNYGKRWFPFDFLVISLDWLMMFMNSGVADLVGIMRISKVLRMIRIFRLFRLLRVLKMPALLDD